jgi:nucleoside-diphosphate-sugar epimerase
MSGELVLVTGGSGFVGAHCILQLLDAGLPRADDRAFA